MSWGTFSRPTNWNAWCGRCTPATSPKTLSRAEWSTPGHPLFEAVREDVLDRVAEDMQRGSVFYDLHCNAPYLLDVFCASAKDGRGNHLHRKLFVVQIEGHGQTAIKQPTVFLD